jgi:hypothetical protein
MRSETRRPRLDMACWITGLRRFMPPVFANYFFSLIEAKRLLFQLKALGCGWSIEINFYFFLLSVVRVGESRKELSC